MQEFFDRWKQVITIEWSFFVDYWYVWIGILILGLLGFLLWTKLTENS